MRLTITLDGVSHSVAVTPGDLVRLERQFKISASTLDESSPLEWSMYLGYSAAKRTGIYEGSFDEFLDVVGMAEEEEAPKA